MDDLRAALSGVKGELLAREHVVAAGIGYKMAGGKRTGDLSIVCSVVKKVPEALLAADDLVPPEIRGIPTDVVETGVLRALLARTDRWRPAPGGVSLGHPATTAGTQGCLVRKNGETLILSNNHVLAAENAAAIGDPILQPGAYDGGSDPADRIAVLEEFVPIRFLSTEPSDCTVARFQCEVKAGRIRRVKITWLTCGLLMVLRIFMPLILKRGKSTSTHIKWVFSSSLPTILGPRYSSLPVMGEADRTYMRLT